MVGRSELHKHPMYQQPWKEEGGIWFLDFQLVFPIVPAHLMVSAPSSVLASEMTDK